MSHLKLSEVLKEYTKTNHQLLEGKIIPRIKAIRSTADYASLLTLFYTFFGGLELLIDKSLHIYCMPDYAQRRKTASLAVDLQQLNSPVISFAEINYLPVIKTNFQSLGALYVIEGSTLGGTVITRMIQDQLLVSGNSGFNFFKGYGELTVPMWQQFKDSINRITLGENDEATIVRSANDTFLRFSACADQ